MSFPNGFEEYLILIALVMGCLSLVTIIVMISKWIISIDNEVRPEKQLPPMNKVIISFALFISAGCLINFIFAMNDFSKNSFVYDQVYNCRSWIINICILSVFLLFTTSWIMKKYRPHSLVGLLLVATVGYTCFYGVEHYYSLFTPDKWQMAKECRIRMVQDMIDSKALTGKSLKETDQILGKDDSEKPQIIMSQGYIYKTSNRYYLLKDESFVESNIIYLILHFDNKGIFLRHEIKYYTGHGD